MRILSLPLPIRRAALVQIACKEYGRVRGSNYKQHFKVFLTAWLRFNISISVSIILKSLATIYCHIVNKINKNPREGQIFCFVNCTCHRRFYVFRHRVNVSGTVIRLDNRGIVVHAWERAKTFFTKRTRPAVAAHSGLILNRHRGIFSETHHPIQEDHSSSSTRAKVKNKCSQNSILPHVFMAVQRQFYLYL